MIILASDDFYRIPKVNITKIICSKLVTDMVPVSCDWTKEHRCGIFSLVACVIAYIGDNRSEEFLLLVRLVWVGNWTKEHRCGIFSLVACGIAYIGENRSGEILLLVRLVWVGNWTKDFHWLAWSADDTRWYILASLNNSTGQQGVKIWLMPSTTWCVIIDDHRQHNCSDITGK